MDADGPLTGTGDPLTGPGGPHERAARSPPVVTTATRPGRTPRTPAGRSRCGPVRRPGRTAGRIRGRPGPP
ncbi:hypothetical protein DQ384_02955 [Sphaerisporangium album]|uniref:Uncharacterized protein n=1 Tax=Sphaerisporangium album TaxID=509200 RepID=A0A367FRE4_9ACTN|nr:hypothetical protein DQ384_02955 [Sphaerisporangium album]